MKKKCKVGFFFFFFFAGYLCIGEQETKAEDRESELKKKGKEKGERE